MDSYIPYGKQLIIEDDIDEVVKVLRSDYLTQGPKVKEFEDDFGKYVNADYAVAVSNGTAALHLSILALGIKPGDKVITTTLSFSATANCIKYCGGEVLFADIDPETYLIDIKSVKSIFNHHPTNSIKGIITVDFAGKGVNLEEFRDLSDKYNCWLLQDSCHSPGGYFINSNGNKQMCGNGKYADAAIFSFHPVKHIAAGEGGMITTNNLKLAEKLRLLRTHGIEKNPERFLEVEQNLIERNCSNDTINEIPGWYMEMQYLGYNYRLTEIQSALGCSQLKRAPLGLKKRHSIAKKYIGELSRVQIIRRIPEYDEGHAYHLFVIEVNFRNKLYEYLKSKKILAQIHYIPIHLMPYYKKESNNPNNCERAENYFKYCISLPIYPSLKEDELNHVINCIKDFDQAIVKN